MLGDNRELDAGSGPNGALFRHGDTHDPVLNVARLSEIELMLGPATTTGLLLLLKDEIVRRTGSIEQLRSGGDRSAAAIALHDLKGAALNMGAERIGNLAAQFEHACAGDRLLLDFVSRLNAVAQETVAAIDARMNDEPSR